MPPKAKRNASPSTVSVSTFADIHQDDDATTFPLPEAEVPESQLQAAPLPAPPEIQGNLDEWTISKIIERIARTSGMLPRWDSIVYNSAENANGSFAKCTARFSSSDTAKVDAFLNSVLTYKDVYRVSDKNALRGLSLLLEDCGSQWWIGVKSRVTDWKTAVSSF